MKTTKKMGRPKKVLAEGKVKKTIEFRAVDLEYIERMAEITGDKNKLGLLIRKAVATHAGLVPLITQQHQDMAEMRTMFEDMKAMLRTIARFQAAAKRELGDEDESTSAVEGFTPDFSFADEQ
ncbi:hypothetical protein [Ensifer sp. B1-9]|uniref:hypothetical protein n=1 Tax=Ensifer sp. B1-9 TaxID=3141455 RepID=UPI003D2179CA